MKRGDPVHTHDTTTAARRPNTRPPALNVQAVTTRYGKSAYVVHATVTTAASRMGLRS
ncbi:hypothetical protein [Streptomyces sp. PpalLS-921]|uniref:hypothetical protein n=1 Tax=Streptomyces sp. PpalLS-921 TaxID=1839772 RepID=UPI00081DE322|nr:hypothetical protein [Streptomyces sp. PpalLS-921]SCD52580.1 hypothetical protein GA0115249_105236 [Streptomyces sp. PpalLS-921]